MSTDGQIKRATQHREESLFQDAQGIANAFFRAGYIESWGRGIEKTIASAKNMILRRHSTTTECLA